MIFEQTDTEYDDVGNAMLVKSSQRLHNASTGTPGEGPLRTATIEPLARVNCVATWYDGVGRPTVTGDYGADNAEQFSRPVPVPTSSTVSVLVTRAGYNSRGEAEATWDAKGTETYQVLDDAGHVVRTVQNYHNGDVLSGLPSEDVTVEYTYNTDGLVETQAALNQNIEDQGQELAGGTVVACTANDSGYLMYSSEPINYRFYPEPSGSETHVVAVYYDTTACVWKYDSGFGRYTFTPRPDDLLMAAVTFGPTRSVDQVLANVPGSVHGIRSGYKAGASVNFTAPGGVFTVTGGSFERNILTQVTTYVYGVDFGGSQVCRNDLLHAVIYPDSDDCPDFYPGSGLPAAGGPVWWGSDGVYDHVQYEYYANGQTMSMMDQNGTSHQYSRDKLGRIDSDSIQQFGDGVDQNVRAINSHYDLYGNVDRVTSVAPDYSVVDEVFRRYDALGRLREEYQARSGPVTPTTPCVQYLYDDTASGNELTKGGRQSATVYPNGRIVDYLYGDTAADRTRARLVHRRQCAGDDTGHRAGRRLVRLGFPVALERPRRGFRQRAV